MKKEYGNDAVENYCIARQRQFDTISNGALWMVGLVTFLAIVWIIGGMF